MSFYNHQDQVLLNWLHSCDEKDVATAFMIPNVWSSYSSPDAVPSVSPIQSAVYEDSPIISTPSLYNGPTFTGDPMELLINKSKGVNSSPIYSSSPSVGVATPLFDPIESAHNDDGSSNQQYGLQQHDINAFLQENHPYEVKNEPMDWPCFHGGDISLFHELEGMINTHINTHSNNNNNDNSDSNTSSAEWSTAASTITQKQKKNTSGRKATTKKMGATKRNGQQGNDDDNKNNKKRPAATKVHKTEQGEKRFACPICRRKFSRRYNLNTHIRTHNVNRIKEYACDICDYRFDRKHDRDRHLISVHHGERDYACQQCDASFCRRDALARHTLKSHPPQ